MAGYSMDLRERVVAAVKVEGLSRRAAAARFGVSYSAAIEWLKRVEETGSVRPVRSAATSRRRYRALGATGWSSAAERRTSPCAALWPNLTSAA